MRKDLGELAHSRQVLVLTSMSTAWETLNNKKGRTIHPVSVGQLSPQPLGARMDAMKSPSSREALSPKFLSLLLL